MASLATNIIIHKVVTLAYYMPAIHYSSNTKPANVLFAGFAYSLIEYLAEREGTESCNPPV